MEEGWLVAKIEDKEGIKKEEEELISALIVRGSSKQINPLHMPWSHWHIDGEMLWISCRVASGLNRFGGNLTLGDISHKI